ERELDYEFYRNSLPSCWYVDCLVLSISTISASHRCTTPGDNEKFAVESVHKLCEFPEPQANVVITIRNGGYRIGIGADDRVLRESLGPVVYCTLCRVAFDDTPLDRARFIGDLRG